MGPRYFEDLEIGNTRERQGEALDAGAIIAFAREFDPEPFHTDPTAARDSHFGGLVASGAHTFALWRRLGFESQREHCWVTLAGAGFDEMRLHRPVRPGDTLRLRSELLEKRPSRSKADRGVIRTRETLLNQNGEVVLTLTCTAIVARRPAADPASS